MQSSHQRIVWTIAGSDSGGGAGVQADLKTFHRLGVHGCSVITAVTAQNSVAVDAIEYISPAVMTAQLAALAADMPARVIKLGMQGAIQPVRDFLASYPAIIILDPVITASSGAHLNSNIEALSTLIPLADIVTPNITEAEQLTGMAIRNHEDMIIASLLLIRKGARRVLLKGGHGSEKQLKSDYYTDGIDGWWLVTPLIHTPHTHGSGCTLAAALAAHLALGCSWRDSLVMSKMYVQQAIRLATPIGSGPGAVIQADFPRTPIDLPAVTYQPLSAPRPAFKRLDPIGLYPIVDSAEWVQRLASTGVRVIQLRIKNQDTERHAENVHAEIKRAVRIARAHSIILIVNDYWQFAIACGADGVHLGQTDLLTANVDAIRKAGLYLGISTHCFDEVARAHAWRPSYIACGPIFATTSKNMPFSPQGLERLAYWRAVLDYPLVAIGGINRDRLSAVLETGVDGVAMISCITEADDPEGLITTLKQIHAAL